MRNLWRYKKNYKSKMNSHREQQILLLKGQMNISLVLKLAIALEEQLYSLTRGTGASLCFHGDLNAFTAHCQGRLCLKMPIKHNRSQQIIPAQKIK